MSYKLVVENKGSDFSYADDQRKIIFDMPADQKKMIEYLGNKVNVRAQFKFKPSNQSPHLSPSELIKAVKHIAEMEIKLGLSDRHSFEEFLKTNMGERLKYEHCDSAEELKAVIDSLRARGALQGSPGISNLVNSVIDEANLADKLVLKDQDPRNINIPLPSIRLPKRPDPYQNR